MGLFGPPKEFRERTFTMPCSRAEALEVISSSSDLDGNSPFGILGSGPVSGPPLMEAIYVESMNDDGFVIAAGNRVRTLWRMRMTLTGDNPTSGTFGALEVNDQRWFGNVMGAVFALDKAVRSVGGRRGKWPTG